VARFLQLKVALIFKFKFPLLRVSKILFLAGSSWHVDSCKIFTPSMNTDESLLDCLLQFAKSPQHKRIGIDFAFIDRPLFRSKQTMTKNPDYADQENHLKNYCGHR
jgi:hypothetical protein